MTEALKLGLILPFVTEDTLVKNYLEKPENLELFSAALLTYFGFLKVTTTTTPADHSPSFLYSFFLS